MKHTRVETRLYTTEAWPPTAVAATRTTLTARKARRCATPWSSALFVSCVTISLGLETQPRAVPRKESKSGSRQVVGSGTNKPNVGERDWVTTSECAKQTQFSGHHVGQRSGNGGLLRETKPISGRLAGAGGRNVRNKAKLGKTGACGQRRSPRAGWSRREVKRAKRSQFGEGF